MAFLLCIGLPVQHQNLFLILKSPSEQGKAHWFSKEKHTCRLLHLNCWWSWILFQGTLPETDSKFAPENGCLVQMKFPLWDGLFSGDMLALGRVFAIYTIFIKTLGVTELAARNGNQLSEDAMAQVYPQWCYGRGYGKMYRCYYGNVLISGFWRGDGLKDEDHDDWYR